MREFCRARQLDAPYIRDLGRWRAGVVAPYIQGYILQNIRADRALDRRFYVGHADAQRALLAGDQDDRRGQGVLVPGHLLGELGGQLLGHIDDGVVLLGHAVQRLPARLGGVHRADLQPQGLEAQHAVLIAHGGNLIHLPYPLTHRFPGAGSGWCPHPGPPHARRKSPGWR